MRQKDPTINPLMGWETSSNGPLIRNSNLEFSSKESAIELCKKETKLILKLIEPQKKERLLKNHTPDNFFKIIKMFKFFTKKKWQLWSWLGSFVNFILIVGSSKNRCKNK